MKNVWEAMSDPTRRKILTLLRRRDMNAGDIAANFDMSKPSISKHLDVLKQADLIRAEKQGQFIIYSLNTSVVEDFASLLAGFVQGKNKNLEGKK